MSNPTIAFFATTTALVLAAVPVAAQRLITIDTTPGADTVYEVSTTSATKTAIGTVSANHGVPGSITYDSVTGRLYSSDTANDQLYVFDVTDWSATSIGVMGPSAIAMHGIEIDVVTGTLYGMSYHDAGLYQIGKTTGVATRIGVTGLPINTNGFALAYDLANLAMYVTRKGDNNLYTIDLTTAAVTAVGAHNLPSIGDMAYSVDDGQLYAVDNFNDVLYRLDVSTGAATVVGSVGAGTNMICLTYIPGAGRLTRAPHACGPTTITPSGVPAPGGTIQVGLGGVVGLPVMGVGFNALSVPFCGCTVGHDWSLLLVGGSLQLTVPASPVWLGSRFHVQGADLGGVGGCPNPQFAGTDTITVAIN